jgi:hypothetical protein
MANCSCSTACGCARWIAILLLLAFGIAVSVYHSLEVKECRQCSTQRNALGQPRRVCQDYKGRDMNWAGMRNALLLYPCQLNGRYTVRTTHLVLCRSGRLQQADAHSHYSRIPALLLSCILHMHLYGVPPTSQWQLKWRQRCAHLVQSCAQLASFTIVI